MRPTQYHFPENFANHGEMMSGGNGKGNKGKGRGGEYPSLTQELELFLFPFLVNGFFVLFLGNDESSRENIILFHGIRN